MVHDALYDLLGDGIFTVDGAEWKVQRQASAHLFKKRLMHEAVRTFLDHADDVEAFLDDHIKSNEAFDVQQMFSAFTMDSFIEICFGKKLSVSEQSANERQVAVANNVDWCLCRRCEVTRYRLRRRSTTRRRRSCFASPFRCGHICRRRSSCDAICAPFVRSCTTLLASGVPRWRVLAAWAHARTCCRASCRSVTPPTSSCTTPPSTLYWLAATPPLNS